PTPASKFSGGLGRTRGRRTPNCHSGIAGQNYRGGGNVMFAVRTDVEVRESLLARLADARAQTDALFDVVRPDSLYERPIAERHRIVFYLGHLEAFDWNLLREPLLNRKAFQPGFDRLFAFGIDPVDGGLPADQPADWPSLAEI